MWIFCNIEWEYDPGKKYKHKNQLIWKYYSVKKHYTVILLQRSIAILHWMTFKSCAFKTIPFKSNHLKAMINFKCHSLCLYIGSYMASQDRNLCCWNMKPLPSSSPCTLLSVWVLLSFVSRHGPIRTGSVRFHVPSIRKVNQGAVDRFRFYRSCDRRKTT